MVSLNSDCVSPVEVLVELVTSPSDGEHLFSIRTYRDSVSVRALEA